MLLTVSEVAKQLKVNRNFVYKLIKDGELEAVKVGSIKVRLEALNRYVDSCKLQGGDKMKLFPHQQEVLKQTEDKNRVAYYLDMGLG